MKYPPSFNEMAKNDVGDYDDKAVDIYGCISPRSQGGWPVEQSNYSVHCFTFTAWCFEKEKNNLAKNKLIILRAVKPEANNYWDDYPPCSIQKLRVYLSKDQSRAILDKSLPLNETNLLLEEIASKLKEPITYISDYFGEFSLDKNIGWFEKEEKWNELKITLVIDNADNSTIDTHDLMTAQKLWEEQKAWGEKINTFVIDELLELKNETWCDEDDNGHIVIISDVQFLERISLKSIIIHPEGEFEFYFDDGDLFFGHTILVHGNIEKGIIGADIAG